jgi:peptidoglycan hydrolase-like protein with peptidoglycan-binding domain
MKIVTKFVAIAVVALALVAGASNADAAFARYLTVGSTGTDVTELQTILVSGGYLVMPAGVPMGTFGQLTKNAVAKWQAAVGLPATGYFGPLSIAKIGGAVSGQFPAGCSSASGYSSTTGMKCDAANSNSGSTGGSIGGGDGDFKDFDILGNPDSTDIGEGETEEVLGFEFEANDSDLKIDRLDVLFGETGSDTDKPWKVLEEVTLTIDGKEVGSIDASDADNWDEEENDQYSIKFDDIDTVVKEDDAVKAYITVTAQDNLDTADQGNWSVELMDDGIRAINGDGIDVYEVSADDDIDGDSDERTFTLEEAQVGDLDISIDDNDNEDMDVAVDDDNDTNDVTIYTATLDSQDGDNNIEEVTVNISTTTLATNGLSDFVKTLYLFLDGEEVGSESVTDTGTDSVVFDDLDVTIEEGDEIDFVVKVDFDSTDDGSNYSTTTAGLYVTGVVVDFVDQNDDDVTLTDTTDGGDISLKEDALSVDLVSTPSAVTPVANDESKGQFYVEFKVTAPKDEDIYIAKGATTSTSVSSGKGAEFSVLDGNGDALTATTTAATNILSKISGGSESSGYWKIAKGTSATFKLDVIIDNNGGSAAKTAGIQLTGVNYKVGSAAVADNQFNAGLDEDFRSDTAYLLTSNTSN